MSKIEQIIEDMQGYFAECKSPAFSGGGKMICEKNVIEEFLDDLKLTTPEEIKKYQKIINQKESILSEAKNQANAIIADAQKQADKLLDSNEIMRRAYDQAQQVVDTARDDASEIINNATEDGNNIRLSAIKYTDNLLSDLQVTVDTTIAAQEEKHNNLIANLRDLSDTVASNRAELSEDKIASEKSAEDNSVIEDLDIVKEEIDKTPGSFDAYEIKKDSGSGLDLSAFETFDESADKKEKETHDRGDVFLRDTYDSEE